MTQEIKAAYANLFSTMRAYLRQQSVLPDVGEVPCQQSRRLDSELKQAKDNLAALVGRQKTGQAVALIINCDLWGTDDEISRVHHSRVLDIKGVPF